MSAVVTIRVTDLQDKLRALSLQWRDIAAQESNVWRVTDLEQAVYEKCARDLDAILDAVIDKRGHNWINGVCQCCAALTRTFEAEKPCPKRERRNEIAP